MEEKLKIIILKFLDKNYPIINGDTIDLSNISYRQMLPLNDLMDTFSISHYEAIGIWYKWILKKIGRKYSVITSHGMFPYYQITTNYEIKNCNYKYDCIEKICINNKFYCCPNNKTFPCPKTKDIPFWQ